MERKRFGLSEMVLPLEPQGSSLMDVLQAFPSLHCPAAPLGGHIVQEDTERLSDKQILAKILGLVGGAGDAGDLAGRLLCKFGDFGAVFSADPNELLSIDGMEEDNVFVIKIVAAATGFVRTSPR